MRGAGRRCTIGEGARAGAAAPSCVGAAAKGSRMRSTAGEFASAGVRAVGVRATSGMTSSGCFSILVPASVGFELSQSMVKKGDMGKCNDILPTGDSHIHIVSSSLVIQIRVY